MEDEVKTMKMINPHFGIRGVGITFIPSYAFKRELAFGFAEWDLQGFAFATLDPRVDDRLHLIVPHLIKALLGLRCRRDQKAG
jgi:hypothetical protein